MFFRFVKAFIAMFLFFLFACSGLSFGQDIKHHIKRNMTVVYDAIPPDASSISSMLSDGIFYGRIRFNTFRWNWDETIPGKTRDNIAVGLGGSLVYKSAYFHNIGFTAGLYTSHNPWHMDSDGFLYVKSGKDLFCRRDVAQGDGYQMTVLAESYLEYRTGGWDLKFGRQKFESLLTASNDTKMIPNTFSGLSFHLRGTNGIGITTGYFTRQKLRDHIEFHHVLAYGDDPADPFAKWEENDDSAMHKGLTLSRLAQRGIDDRLIVVEMQSNGKNNLFLRANYTAVPNLLFFIAGELGYKVSLGGSFSVVPAVRYIRQFDRGAGVIGGASLSGNVNPADPRGYSDPDNLDSSLYALRVDIKKDASMLRIGFSKVADQGDFVTPWRGFPTGGYTRAMGQYNWYADTKTLMAQFSYDFSNAGVVPGLFCMIRVAWQDYDDAKPDVPADSIVYSLDLVRSFSWIPGLSAKIRLERVSADDDIKDMFGNIKPDSSRTEARFEVNILF